MFIVIQVFKVKSLYSYDCILPKLDQDGKTSFSPHIEQERIKVCEGLSTDSIPRPLARIQYPAEFTPWVNKPVYKIA